MAAHLKRSGQARKNDKETDLDKMNLKKMRTTTKKIVLYLEKKGKMSVSDICNDTGVDGLDIEIAQLDDRAIQEVLPPFGASSFPWFVAREQR